MTLLIGHPSTRNASCFRRSRCQMPPKRGQRHSEPSNQRFCWPRWRCKGFLSDWGVLLHLDRNASPYSWCQIPRSRRRRPTSCHTNLNVSGICVNYGVKQKYSICFASLHFGYQNNNCSASLVFITECYFKVVLLDTPTTDFLPLASLYISANVTQVELTGQWFSQLSS